MVKLATSTTVWSAILRNGTTEKRHPFPRRPWCIQVYNRYAFLTSYQEFDENPIANTGLEMSRYNCCIVLKKKDMFAVRGMLLCRKGQARRYQIINISIIAKITALSTPLRFSSDPPGEDNLS